MATGPTFGHARAPDPAAEFQAIYSTTADAVEQQTLGIPAVDDGTEIYTAFSRASVVLQAAV
jgi:hypothetical protein